MANNAKYWIGHQYTRNDIYEILGVPLAKRGGDWLNGYHRHGSDYYVFCNVGSPGRTGHDYPNEWNGPILKWHGKNGSHFGQAGIERLLSESYRTLIFYRWQDRDPFTFAGVGYPIPHLETRDPVRIDWRFCKYAWVDPA